MQSRHTSDLLLCLQHSREAFIYAASGILSEQTGGCLQQGTTSLRDMISCLDILNLPALTSVTRSKTACAYFVVLQAQLLVVDV